MITYEKDLVVLVPDKNMQFLFYGLLSKSTALGMRMPSHQLDTHPLRDSGCLDADEFLESQASRYAHALVVTNGERSGRMGQGRAVLEATIEGKLANSGWGQRACAIVVEPGIGRWLLEHLFQELCSPGIAVQQALDAALRRKKIPQSPALYRALGMQLVDEVEPDPAWQKILSTLKGWFGIQSGLRKEAPAYDGSSEGLFVRLEPLSRAGKLDAALDLVFDHVDDLLLAGRFPEVNRLLCSVPVGKLDPAILIGFLTITGPARGALDARSAFAVRVRDHLHERMPPEELARVMLGLE
jgi:hypothetical protein